MKFRRIAFLRAINVGGRNVKMDELKDIVASLGFARVATHIASGNVIFEAALSDDRKIEQMLEQALQERLGFAVNVFVRSCSCLRELLAAPIGAEPAVASNIIFLKDRLDAQREAQLQLLVSDVDRFEVQGRHIAWQCNVKQSDSKFSNALLERKLKLSSTIRTRRTIAAIVQRFCD